MQREKESAYQSSCLFPAGPSVDGRVGRAAVSVRGSKHSADLSYKVRGCWAVGQKAAAPAKQGGALLACCHSTLACM